MNSPMQMAGTAGSDTPDRKVPERFVNEDLADHWCVRESDESFRGLLDQLERKTNFRTYFEAAFADSALSALPAGLRIADIGAGVGWTSALMARDPRVAKVYVVEPSGERRASAPHIARHFGVEPEKLDFIDGTFDAPKVPEPVDVVLMSGSFHHCPDPMVAKLFENIRGLLKPGGLVLIANEHYVGWQWTFRRFLSWGKNLLLRRRRMYYWPGNLHAPDPWDGEQWRTRRRIESIFAKAGFDARIEPFDGDLCKDKPTWLDRLGWTYYYAVLTPHAA